MDIKTNGARNSSAIHIDKNIITELVSKYKELDIAVTDPEWNEEKKDYKKGKIIGQMEFQGKSLNVIVFTNDEFTKTLFEKRQINVIQVMLKDREKFSGTNIRQLILDDKNWEDLVPQGTRKVLDKINATDRLKNL